MPPYLRTIDRKDERGMGHVKGRLFPVFPTVLAKNYSEGESLILNNGPYGNAYPPRRIQRGLTCECPRTLPFSAKSLKLSKEREDMGSGPSRAESSLRIPKTVQGDEIAKQGRKLGPGVHGLL